MTDTILTSINGYCREQTTVSFDLTQADYNRFEREREETNRTFHQRSECRHASGASWSGPQFTLYQIEA